MNLCDSEDEEDDINENPCTSNAETVSPMKQTTLIQLESLASPQSSGICRHRKCIVHIDMDCFYAQVEMLLNPQLRDVPLAVRQKYIIVTSNYKAREMGVEKMSSLTAAKKVCPSLVVVDGENLDKYRLYSDRVYDLWHRYSDKVEKLGLDENFIDVTALVDSRISAEDQPEPIASDIPGHVIDMSSIDNSAENVEKFLRERYGHVCACGCRQRLAVASVIASEMRAVLCEEIGLTSCGGVSHIKLLAKMVGTEHKPNQQTTVFTEQALEFMQRQPARRVPGIGHRCQEILASRGIESMADVARVERRVLAHWLGSRLGNFIWNAARAIDDGSVENTGEAKSLSEEDSYKDMDTLEKVKKELSNLIGQLVTRAAKHSGQPKTIRLSIRKRLTGATQKRESRQANVLLNTSLTSARDRDGVIRDLTEQLLCLLSKMLDTRKAFNLALLNVAFTNFELQKHPASEKLRTGAFFKRTELSGCDSGESESSKDARKGETSFVNGELNCSITQGLLSDTIPPNIDREVFQNLPSEIKEELVHSWRTADLINNCSVTTKGKSHKRSNKDNCKTNTISKYFKTNN